MADASLSLSRNHRLSIVHENAVDPIQHGAPPQVSPHYCEPCGISFPLRKSLLRHWRETKAHQSDNSSGTSHSCDICFRVFIRNDMLLRHVREGHRGQKRASSDLSRNPGSGSLPRDSRPAKSRTLGSVAQRNDTTPSIDQILSGKPLDPNDFMQSEHDAAFLEPYSPFTVGPSQSAPSNQGLVPATGTTSFRDVFDGVSVSTGHHISSPDDLSTGGLSFSAIQSPLSDTNTWIEGVEASKHAEAHRLTQLSPAPYRSDAIPVAGRNLRPTQLRSTRPCPLCGEELGSTLYDGLEVQQHMAMCKDRLEHKADISCTDCDIKFCHIKDLEAHLQSLKRDGTCGLQFTHAREPCVGHHPPTIDGQVHEDHQNFKERLAAWERCEALCYADFIAEYAKGSARTNAPAFGQANPYFRRSTGSQFTARSSGSWLSSMTLPASMKIPDTNGRHLVRQPLARILQLGQQNSSRRTTDAGASLQRGRHLPDTSCIFDPKQDLETRLTCAIESERPELVKQVLKQHGDHLTGLTDERLDAKINATWFTPHVKANKIWIVAALVEQGMRISTESTESLAIALRQKTTMDLLLEETFGISIGSPLILSALCSAISGGYIDVVASLLNRDIVKPGNSLHLPPQDLVQTLHRRHAKYRYSPTCMGPDWTTDYPLALALDSGHHTIASLLINRRANAYNTLVKAAQISDIKTLNFLCAHGVHSNFSPRRQRWINFGQPDVLHDLANLMSTTESPELLLRSAECLISHNIYPDICDSNSRTPLMIICAMQSKVYDNRAWCIRQYAERLCEQGANINARDSHSRSPLMHAVIAGNHAAMEFILAKNPDLEAADHKGVEVFEHAMRNGHPQIFMGLIAHYEVRCRQNNIEPYARLYIDWLQEALKHDHKELACRLLRSEMGQDFGAYITEHQFTLLYALLEFGNDDDEFQTRTAKLLLSRETRLQQALQIALRYGKVRLATLVLKEGAYRNRNLRSDFDIFIAIQSGNPATVLLLLENIPNLAVRDSQGRTPLIVAIAAGCSQSVGWLIQHGADVNETDGFGNTPLAVASRGTDPSSHHISVLLEECGGRHCASAGSDASKRWRSKTREQRLSAKVTPHRSSMARGMARISFVRRSISAALSTVTV